MTFEDYMARDATGLAELVRRGDVSARDLAQTALDAIAALNPQINAVVEAWPDAAENPPVDLAAPFCGVPFLFKDIVLHRQGRKSEMGSRLAQGFIATQSSMLSDLFDTAGLTTIGRTTTPEFGHGPTTEALLYGPTRNPWNRDRMVGGSSGGSAAAVTAGMVPMAHASDGAGSIRTPAACCGLIGLKPSRGRVTSGPASAEGLFGMGTDLAMTRSVRDTAALLDCVSRPMPGDPFAIVREAESYAALATRAPRPLRIAFTTTSWFDAPIDPEIVAATERAAQYCSDFGHQVEEASPVFDYAVLRAACITLWAAGIHRMAHGAAAATGRAIDRDTLESATLAMVRFGDTLGAEDLFRALDNSNAVCRAIGPFFETYDLLLTPTTARPAEPIGTYDQNAPVSTHEQWFDRKALFPPFLAPFNITGQPAISLPLFMSEDGLPIGMQFVGRFGRENDLLQLARQFEQALRWEDRLVAMQRGLLRQAATV